MLNVPARSVESLADAQRMDPARGEAAAVDLTWLTGAARRQLWVILAGIILGAALAVAYSVTALPLYTATTRLLIDPRARVSSGVSDRAVDPGAVESQIAVIKSEKVATSVAEELDLFDNPPLNPSSRSILKQVVSTVRSWVPDFRDPEPEVVDAESADFLKKRSVIEALEDNLQVNRIGLSYVLDIEYTSASPEQAADVANGFGTAYLSELLDAQYESARRVSDWLGTRVGQLKQQVLDSDLAVQRYRAENNLITADGRLLGDQQLTELNSQLIVARNETAQAEAKWQSLSALVKAGNVDAVVTDSLENPIINDLRAKYGEASRREADISARLGEQHMQAQNLREQMREYQRLIFAELNRIEQSYQSDFQVAKARQESLERNLESLVGTAANANETMVQLRQLEREAETYRTLYEAFLQRYQDAIERQSFPSVEARSITRASKPLEPSHPNKGLALLLGIATGCAAGIGLGGLREFRERGFRTAADVVDVLNQSYIGSLPMVPVPNGGKRSSSKSGSGDQSKRLISAPPIMRHALDNPLSGFAETLRGAKVAADLSLGVNTFKTIGIASVLPSEGKTTVSKNFASLIASQGHKTLLIDGDLRNPGLTRALAPRAEAGLVESLHDGRLIADRFYFEQETRLAFLPAVVRRRVAQSSMLLSSPMMKSLLAEASEAFDYAIMDLPPLGPVVDARAVASQIDAFILVVEWGETARKLVQTTLAREHELRSKCLGVILNKVDPNKILLYEDYGSASYYGSQYRAYN